MSKKKECDEDNPSNEENSEEKDTLDKPFDLEGQLKFRRKLWKMYSRKPKHGEKDV